MLDTNPRQFQLLGEESLVSWVSVRYIKKLKQSSSQKICFTFNLKINDTFSSRFMLAGGVLFQVAAHRPRF